MRPPLPEPIDFGLPWVADELAEWRKARRVSQTALADILGVSHAAISYWENGLRPIPGWLHLAMETIDRRLAQSHFQLPAQSPRPR